MDIPEFPRMLVADDHALTREGIVLLIRSRWPDAACTPTRDHAETMSALAGADPAFDAVVLDLRMPGVDGFEGVSDVVEAAGASPVIVCTAVDDPGLSDRMSRLGVLRIVHKNRESRELLAALEEVFARSSPPRAARPSACADGERSIGSAQLSGRRRDILRLLHQGKSNKGIARQLDIGVGTVKAHLYVLYKAMNVTSRSEAIAKSRNWFI